MQIGVGWEPGSSEPSWRLGLKGLSWGGVDEVLGSMVKSDSHFTLSSPKGGCLCAGCLGFRRWVMR